MTRVESITVAPTTERKTTPGRFELALQGATRTLAAGVVGTVELAAPAVPFGTVLAGAVRGVAPPAAGLRSVAGAGTGLGSGTAGAGGTAAGVAAATGSQGDILEATRAMQQEAQAMNLQYLQLQEQMQQESREFTALTNVMRVKHDSARAAIGNIH
jgi:hypothetical protein